MQLTTFQIGGLAASAGPIPSIQIDPASPYKELAVTIPTAPIDASNIKRAKDLIGAGFGNFSVPLSPREIKNALSEVQFLVERLPLTPCASRRVSITIEQLVHVAVVWALANALVNNARVEVVG